MEKNPKTTYLGKKIVKIIDYRDPSTPKRDDQHPLPKCSCLRAMGFVNLTLVFEDGSSQDFCSSCREAILYGLDTGEELQKKWSIKIREQEALEKSIKEALFDGVVYGDDDDYDERF